MGAFEKAARRRRAAELERRLAELDAWDRRYGLGGAPPGHPSRRPDTTWRHHSPQGQAASRAFDAVPQRPSRRRARWGRSPVVLLLLAAVLVAGAVTFPAEAATVRGWATQAARSVMGVPATESAPQAQEEGFMDEVVQRWASGPGTSGLGWEPPRGARVLPAVEPETSGSYAFLQTQPGSGAPVGFSPCGSVPVEVNAAGAPEGYTELVQASLARVGAASGLDLVLVGETDEVWTEVPRELGAPVVVSWSDPDAVPALAGMSAGLGGATYVDGPDGRLWHASGQVVLDTTDLSTWEQHSAVLDHELGHVLGLDHVDDQGELMAAVNTGVAGFGPGDLAGLAALGAISCPGP